jgi:hypothetical protein
MANNSIPKRAEETIIRVNTKESRKKDIREDTKGDTKGTKGPKEGEEQKEVVGREVVKDEFCYFCFYIN